MFRGLSRIRTYNVYPKGPDLQSGAEPPSLQSTQIKFVAGVGIEPTTVSL